MTLSPSPTGIPGQSDTRSESPIRAALRETLIETFHDPRYSPPPLPTVALDIMELTSQSDVSTGAVVTVLERDSMLAGAVMRLVSSPLYAGRSRIETLDDAVVRLGLNTVRDAVFEAALRQGVFRVPEYNETLEQVRRHSVVTAYITRLVCRSSDTRDPHAFLCGLFHDVGFAAALLSIARVEPDPPSLHRIWRDIVAVHEVAGRIVAQCWQLPDSICDVIANHHGVQVERRSNTVAALIVADALSQEFGADVVGPIDAAGTLETADGVDVAEHQAALALLGFGEAAFERLRQETEELIPNILWL